MERGSFAREHRPHVAAALRRTDPYERLAIGATLFYGGDATNTQVLEALGSSQASVRERARDYLTQRVNEPRFRQLQRLAAAARDPIARAEMNRILLTSRPARWVFREFVPRQVILY